MPQNSRHYLDLMTAALLATLVVFGYPLTHFSLHIDQEIVKLYSATRNDIGLGRWGIVFLHATLLPEPFVPFFTPLLSLIFLAASAACTAMALDFTVPQCPSAPVLPVCVILRCMPAIRVST